MTTIKIAMPPLHKAQEQVRRSPARFKILACGRRWGKTMLGILLCIAKAAKRGRAWWVAPTFKIAQIAWRMLVKLGKQIPGATIVKGDMMAIFPGEGWVQIKSADNPDSLRGEGLDFLVIDECAFTREEAWSEALRPALSDREGEALLISTPQGRNWFWRLWVRGQDESEPDYRSWRFPTVSNPYISAKEVEAARQELPERVFQQEYLAEFLEGSGVVFRGIDQCLHTNNDTPDAHAGHTLIAGVDWAKSEDFTAISICCKDCHREVAQDRFNQIDYAFQRQRLIGLCQVWGVERVIAESNAMGEPVIEQLNRDGLNVEGFQTTASSKPPLIESLALAFERQEWQWLASPVWTAELEAYTMRMSAHGRPQYSAPDGLHDDTVMARALAHHGCTFSKFKDIKFLAV